MSLSEGELSQNKRSYTTRKGEWGEETPTEIFSRIVNDITPALKTVENGINTLAKEGKPEDPELLAKKKELKNLRVRAYARIRALSGDIKALRKAYKEKL